MEETSTSIINNPGGTPQLEHRLHWSNSSNVLCNYMREPSYLDLVLKNRAIIPRYVIEKVEYLDIKDFGQICFPMTCFCDIPFSKSAAHMTRYGQYGIGLDKASVLHRYRIQPIHYMSLKSPLIDDFKEAFQPFYMTEKELSGDARLLLNYLVSTLMYMKPIWGNEIKDDGTEEQYVYQDECEWRYIPSDHFPKELHLILPPPEATEIGKQKYSEALAKHSECWLRFEWQDVKYIIVPSDCAKQDTIQTILSLGLSTEEKLMLISKIEVSNRFSDDM